MIISSVISIGLLASPINVDVPYYLADGEPDRALTELMRALPEAESCYELSSQAMQVQGSDFFDNSSVASALSQLAKQDFYTLTELDQILMYALPSAQLRAAVMSDGVYAIAHSRHSQLCQDNL